MLEIPFFNSKITEDGKPSENEFFLKRYIDNS